MPVLGGEQLASGDEDCLYLNVFTNEIPKQSKHQRPVLFSIHGGGFVGGSGNFKGNGPDYLLYGEVVIVSFNYRCGAFGFLSLENEEVPGNAGLKDQTLALKWVHDNIDSFGGDPNNVTIFGISAGGASVAYQLLCPPSRGLFHKAIVQSGFALNPWALQKHPRKYALELAKTIGCTSENLDDVLRFLQAASADEVVAAAKEISKNKIGMTSLMFTPSVEVSEAESSLPNTPDILMERGQFAHVPVILGCTMKEGIVFAYDGLNESVFDKINNKHEFLVPSFLGLKPGSVEEKEAEKETWDFYFQGNPVSWDNVNDLLMCQSDIEFSFGMEQTRSYLVTKSSAPVYTYLFTNHSRCMCKGMASMFSEHASKIFTADTCHGADYWFLYTYTLVATPDLTPVDVEAIKKHVKAWTSFASSGDPNHKELGVTWEKDSETNLCYMDIGTTWEMKEGLTLPFRISFWKNICSKYCTV
uniref:Carboxylic ester hydrolase n=1 Tax=Graphocephala atropunctata TaxID=36148 RepID=A0A1B6M5T7_9HEMI